MESQLTRPLSQQTKEIIRDYEFRIDTEYVTRPTIQARRRGSYQWHDIAVIVPDTNYFRILADALVEMALHLTPVFDVENGRETE